MDMKQYLLIHLTTFFILLTSYEVNCHLELINPLHCFSNHVKYDVFDINFYFSSKTQNRKKFTNLNSRLIDFNPSRRTVVDVHGLTPQIYPGLINSLRKEFTDWGDINLIEVDWRKGCSDPVIYIKAVVNTEYVAKKIKDLFMPLIEEWKSTNKSTENWGPLHFIGHSLGAHVVGQAAELLRQNNVTVDRVTGLDPAGPCFHNPNLPLRLKKSNARFVDAIHTDGGTLDKFQFGILDPVGHLDFYVNGGRIQPGCPTLRFKRESIDLIQLGKQLIIDNGLCQHLRAYNIFAATLKQAVIGQCTFWAYPWSSKNLLSTKPPRGINSCNKERCIEMGINAENYRNVTGVFYVPTSGKSPYCNN